MTPAPLPRSLTTFSRVPSFLLRLGLPMGPLRLLQTQGRKTGRPIATPVAMTRFEGHDWLVSPFGDVGWVLNYRANAVAALGRGRARRSVVLVEVEDERRLAVLRHYRSAFRVVPFVRDAFTARPSDPLEAFAAEADQHPVFKLSRRGGPEHPA